MECPVDEQLLSAATAGDRSAQERVLLSIHDTVRSALFRQLLGRSRDLDDLTQLALLRVLTGLPSYRFEAAFTTWVTGICHNVVREHLRKQRRSDPPASLEEGSAAVATLSQLEARSTLGRCARVISKMTPEHRNAFVLRVLEGHSIDEIAEIMGCAKSTARMRLFYARRAFRRGLKQTRSLQFDAPFMRLSEETGGRS